MAMIAMIAPCPIEQLWTSHAPAQNDRLLSDMAVCSSVSVVKRMTALLKRLFTQVTTGIAAHPARADFAVVGEYPGSLFYERPRLRIDFEVL